VFATILFAAASTLVVATSRGDQSLTVYPPAESAARAHAGTFVLILSGEGGWRSFDDQLARWMSERGYWVGGIDCMRYFWKPQDDRRALASDVSRYTDALVRAAGATGNARVVLAGYSFGADLAPWIGGAPTRDARVAALVLIGPDRQGSLEFRLSEMMGLAPTAHVFDTASALADASGIPILFIHGARDGTSTTPALAEAFTGRKELVVVPGATHHFAGHEEELKHAVLDGLERILTP
jgi:type IV secretory pathway VirJ component